MKDKKLQLLIYLAMLLGLSTLGHLAQTSHSNRQSQRILKLKEELKESEEDREILMLLLEEEIRENLYLNGEIPYWEGNPFK